MTKGDARKANRPEDQHETCAGSAEECDHETEDREPHDRVGQAYAQPRSERLDDGGEQCAQSAKRDPGQNQRGERDQESTR